MLTAAVPSRAKSRAQPPARHWGDSLFPPELCLGTCVSHGGCRAWRGRGFLPAGYPWSLVELAEPQHPFCANCHPTSWSLALPRGFFFRCRGVLATLAPSPTRTHQLLSPRGSPRSPEVTPVQDPPCAPHTSAPLRIVPAPELLTSASVLQRAKQ